MIFSRMLHPEILSVISRAGHGSGVLIADGNYPVLTHSPATAAKVYLNLRRGLLGVTDVLEVLREMIPIERATIMATRDGKPAPIHEEFARLLPAGVEMQTLARFDFYAAVKQPETALVIATGEERRFANLLLTIGVIKPEDKI